MDKNLHASGFNSEGVFTPDNLFDRNTKQRKVTIVAGSGIVQRGTVLGTITASGKHTTSAAAAADGSQNVDVVLLNGVDATSADQEAMAAISGDFNGAGLKLGVGHTLASIDAALRDKNIIVDRVFGE
jgi:hypothetical protein